MNIIKTIAEDIQAVKDRDPAAQGSVIIFLTYPGLHARWAHELEHCLWNHNFKRIARVSSQFTRFMTGVEIHPGAQIGRRFFIDHAMAVIIGETTVIGDDCTLYQAVTLGGTGKETGKRHPTLGNGVLVGVGASVLGNVFIGDNSRVGGGAVVVDDVPANCTVVGVPGHIVVRDGKRVRDEERAAGMHKENLPDPIIERFEQGNQRITALEEQVTQLMQLLQEKMASEADAAAAGSSPADAAAAGSEDSPA